MPRPGFNPVEFFQLKPKDRYTALVYRVWENCFYFFDDREFLKKVRLLESVLRPMYSDIDKLDEKEKAKLGPHTKGFLDWKKLFNKKTETEGDFFAVGNTLLEELEIIMTEAGITGGSDKYAEAIISDEEPPRLEEVQPTEDDI